MSKQREEARFLRGETGVDGAAAEEAKDKGELERNKAREQFLRGKAWLGREMLTWLLYRSESAEPLTTVGKLPLSLLLVDRLVLRGIGGDVLESTVRGATAPYSPLVRNALDRGLLVHQARLHLEHGERSYEVTLDAEYFDIKGAKLPKPFADEDDDKLQERLETSEELAALVRALIETFLELRSSPAWAKTEVPALKQWMRDVEKPRKKRATG
ncbi:MAG TPA: hypothetical protein VH083_09855 [Myxococcales bacterium]|jgi:hypothetical protein|nr:hypothetical protein [Myxococcales bacterium]